MKPNEARLVLELDRRLHTSIKVMAAKKRMTIKNWIIMAIAKAMQEENINTEEENNIES